MPTTTPVRDRPLVAADFDIRHALQASRQDSAWWQSAAARRFLATAQTTLSSVAHRVQADPADALSHAFEIWGQFSDATLADPAIDLWVYTRAAVRRALDREDEAARKVTSVASIRRNATRDFESFTTLDGVELAYEPVLFDGSEAEAETARPTPSDEWALAALAQVLIMGGFSEDQRHLLMDVIADIIGTSPSPRASISRAENVRELFDTAMNAAQWKSLVEIILGTEAGLPGILTLAAEGHPAPAMEPHISVRLMGMLAAAA